MGTLQNVNGVTESQVFRLEMDIQQSLAILESIACGLDDDRNAHQAQSIRYVMDKLVNTIPKIVEVYQKISSQ